MKVVTCYKINAMTNYPCGVLIDLSTCKLLLCFYILNTLKVPLGTYHAASHKFDSFFFTFTDSYIKKSRKNYMDSRARKNLSNINTELQDVHRIMVQNIEDVLVRGESLSGSVYL